jgi:ribosomal protein S17E
MGRIKSTLIKKTARQLLDGENSFTPEFDNNKKLLGRNMPSKSMRNKIAGYLARLKRFEDEENK